jgi:solute carrier family 44 (choline transporter-like protein), member 2/4/5
LEDRSCTDVLFCIIFLAFLGGFGVISIFGYQHGQPDRLLAPLDADGRFCGLDPIAKDYPYLYLALDPTKVANIF